MKWRWYCFFFLKIVGGLISNIASDCFWLCSCIVFKLPWWWDSLEFSEKKEYILCNFKSKFVQSGKLKCGECVLHRWFMNIFMKELYFGCLNLDVASSVPCIHNFHSWYLVWSFYTIFSKSKKSFVDKESMTRQHIVALFYCLVSICILNSQQRSKFLISWSILSF